MRKLFFLFFINACSAYIGAPPIIQSNNTLMCQEYYCCDIIRNIVVCFYYDQNKEMYFSSGFIIK
jgi:hypothetical protein